MIWNLIRIASSVAGFLICNYLTLQGYVPSCSTFFGMVFSVFIISLSFRFFSKFIRNLWGRSFCISIYLIILFYAAIVISYGRIELNAYLITCFAKLLGLLGIGIIILGPTDTLITQMMPSGSEDSSNGSRGSGNWRDYILYPSPEQGEGADFNQLANPPIAAAVAGDQPQSPQGSGLTGFAGLLELPTPTSSEIAAIPSPLPSVEPEGQVVEQPVRDVGPERRRIAALANEPLDRSLRNSLINTEEIIIQMKNRTAFADDEIRAGVENVIDDIRANGYNVYYHNQQIQKLLRELSNDDMWLQSTSYLKVEREILRYRNLFGGGNN